MYLDFFGLEREPFHITPDPDFLYLSPSHKEAFATIVYGVEQRKGFVSLTGEVGTGKTTILRAYLKRIDNEQVRAIYLFNPDLSFSDLLYLLQRELRVDQPESRHEPTMVEQIQLALLRDYEAKRNVCLIVDEAQNMPIETLEKMRMLSNLETTQDKLLQIVLVGQPELDDKLNQHELRQLKQRIAVRAFIRKLTAEESRAYIQHRLMHAGCIREEVFSPAALKRIVQYAAGTPRTLNVVCDNALIAGYGAGEAVVSVKTVDEVIGDLNRTSVSGRRSGRRAAMAAAAGLMLGLLGVFYALNTSDRGEDQVAQAAAQDAPTRSVQSTAAKERAAVPAEADTAPQAEEAPATVEAASLNTDPTEASTERIALRKLDEVNAKLSAAEVLTAQGVLDAASAAIEADTNTTAPANEEAVVSAVSDSLSPAPSAAASETVGADEAEPLPPAGVDATPQEPVSSEAATAPAAIEPAGETTVVAEASSPAVSPVAHLQVFPPERVSGTPEPLPVSESPDSGSEAQRAGGATITRHIAEGDQLLRIIAQTYGGHSPALVAEVRALNPKIQDIDFIRAGDTLVMPAPERVQEGRLLAPDSANTRQAAASTDGNGT